LASKPFAQQKNAATANNSLNFVGLSMALDGKLALRECERIQSALEIRRFDRRQGRGSRATKGGR
jgi:hypothetical protein